MLAAALTVDNNFLSVLSLYLPRKQEPAKQTDLMNKMLDQTTVKVTFRQINVILF